MSAIKTTFEIQIGSKVHPDSWAPFWYAPTKEEALQMFSRYRGQWPTAKLRVVRRIETEEVLAQ